MEIHKGTSRIAFVGGNLTVKVPNPHTLRHLAKIFEYLKLGDLEELRNWFGYTEGNCVGFRWAISGLLQNWREFLLSKELSVIAVPTRLSIFGLLNVQDTAQNLPSTISDKDLFVTMGMAIGPEIMKDPHSVYGTDNFGIHDGRAKMRDYGNVKIGPILKGHIDPIREALKNLMSKPKETFSPTPELKKNK
ncbi:hypothetical protein M0P48_01630 [Candidatus Gracilibacteria bacterium]|nr:hypothetical protein [Candidatus Gracilibacteria bacterium]